MKQLELVGKQMLDAMMGILAQKICVPSTMDSLPAPTLFFVLPLEMYAFHEHVSLIPQPKLLHAGKPPLFARRLLAASKVVVIL
jgi:hypothetical protein